jgi:hypothetical protein
VINQYNSDKDTGHPIVWATSCIKIILEILFIGNIAKAILF